MRWCARRQIPGSQALLWSCGCHPRPPTVSAPSCTFFPALSLPPRSSPSSSDAHRHASVPCSPPQAPACCPGRAHPGAVCLPISSVHTSLSPGSTPLFLASAHPMKRLRLCLRGCCPTSSLPHPMPSAPTDKTVGSPPLSDPSPCLPPPHTHTKGPALSTCQVPCLAPFSPQREGSDCAPPGPHRLWSLSPFLLQPHLPARVPAPEPSRHPFILLLYYVFLLSQERMLTGFRQRGREGEKHRWVASRMRPGQGSNPQLSLCEDHAATHWTPGQGHPTSFQNLYQVTSLPLSVSLSVPFPHTHTQAGLTEAP